MNNASRNESVVQTTYQQEFVSPKRKDGQSQVLRSLRNVPKQSMNKY